MPICDLRTLTSLPIEIRECLDWWIATGGTGVYAWAGDLVACPECHTMRTLFFVFRVPGEPDPRYVCIFCQKDRA